MKEENLYDEYLKDELKKYKDVKTIVFNKPKQEILLEDVFNEEKKKGVKELIDKQKTLEEASWKFNPLKKLDGEFLRHAFKEGAKWQAERSYSEEDMRQAFNNGAWRWIMHSKVDIFKEWLKTHKKK